jgi:hypothetical protein
MQCALASLGFLVETSACLLHVGSMISGCATEIDCEWLLHDVGAV